MQENPTVIPSPLLPHEIAMSSKQPRPSSDDKVDVRRFIDNIVMEEEEEEEDPDQSESSLLHSLFHLAYELKHNFSSMMTVTPLMNPTTPLMIIHLFAQITQKRLMMP